MTEERTVALWLRAQLKENQMTVRELSQRTEIAERDLYRYLAGKHPMPDKLGKLLAAFGYDVPWNRITRVLFEAIVSNSPRTGTYG